MTGPLAGLRVVEVASFVAGPLACLSLAQLGADVIRIDPIGGAADQSRWPLAPSGRSMYWAGLNKEKRSVELDLRSPQGRELAVALATAPGADNGIVVTNAVRGDWISYQALAARRPDIIHARLTGRPDGGPAVDYTVNAGLGYPLVTGADGPPVNHVLPAWDLLAGITLAMSVVVAERNRRITGNGEAISVSLWEVALAATSNLGYLAEAETRADPRERTGNYYYGGFGRDFCTSDGRIMVVALSHPQWARLLDATGLAEQVAGYAAHVGADFAQDSDRFLHRKDLAELFEPWFAARSTKDAVDLLEAAGIVCSPYRTIQQAATLRGPLVGDNPILEVVCEDGIGTIHAARTPVTWRNHPAKPVQPSHPLGADTDEVLGEILGLTSAEIGALVRRGVVRGGMCTATSEVVA
jgi:2-methylfumaryl-CoA isomerase